MAVQGENYLYKPDVIQDVVVELFSITHLVVVVVHFWAQGGSLCYRLRALGGQGPSRGTLWGHIAAQAAGLTARHLQTPSLVLQVRHECCPALSYLDILGVAERSRIPCLNS